MLKEWLQEKTTLEQAEKDHLVKDERLGPDPVPFGFAHERWVCFRGQMKQGDELWKFSSPAESWQDLAGREGLCIVRNGEIVDSIVTMMN
jgi:hypothetical protein